MIRTHPAASALGAAVLCLTVLSGCGQSTHDSIVSAVGSYGDVALLASDQELADALNGFRDRFSPDRTFVIQVEETYRFQTFAGKRWQDGRNYRNLVLCARGDRNGRVEKAARGLVGDENYAHLARSGGVVTVRDPWFRNQIAFVAVAPDANRLVSLLGERATAMGDTLAADINRRIVVDNRSRGLMPDPRRRQWARFGFSIELPKTFKENQSEPDGFPGIEWLRTDGATRGVTVSWEPVADTASALADHAALLAQRRALGAHMHHESIDSAGLVWGEESIHGEPVPYLDGNWTSNEVGVGGPFRCYFFADAAKGRIYCVDLLIYAPNREKMDFARRLRAVLETFSLEEPTS